MTCQKCGREAEQGAKFRVDCGSPLELRCPACQTPFEFGSRFCSLCGRTLPEAEVSQQPDLTDQSSQPDRSSQPTQLSQPDQSPQLTQPTQLDPSSKPTQLSQPDQSPQLTQPTQLDPSSKPTQLAQPDQSSQATQPTQPEQPVQSSRRSLSCPRCHQRNYPDSEYCFACGMPLNDSQLQYQFGDVSDVSSPYSPAGFWVRSLAYIIDVLILSFASIVIVMVLVGDPTTGILESTSFNNLLALLTLVYDTVLIAICATTGGKHQFRLLVVRTDGSRIGPGRALARAIATGLSAIILGLGFLMVAFRKDKRGLHDLICDTKVIRRRGPTS